jgi:hypothetical protein
MNPAERLEGYRERQLELLAAYGELQGKIEQSVRAERADLVAVQSGEALRLASELVELERAARHLAGFAGRESRQAGARLAAGRAQAVQASRRAQALLAASLEELAGRIRELAGRPRTPLSPFARIGQPALVDLHS